MSHRETFAYFMRAMLPAASSSSTASRLPLLTGEGALPSVYAVTPFATAAIGTAASALADYIALRWGRRPEVSTDARLASFWFQTSLRPIGWTVPAVRDAVTGDYPTRDGWIRIHANMAHHRQAAIAVLGCAPERDAVAAAIAHWDAEPLERELVAAHACAAAMRSRTQWMEHEQGRAVMAEPLYHITRYVAADPGAESAADTDARSKAAGGAIRGATKHTDAGASAASATGTPAWREEDGGHATLACPARPLAGLRVLDLTRVLAGPVATRFLAGYGATVLRVDPPWWSEPGMVPEVTVGKRCTELDIRDPRQRETLLALLTGADVLVHGYRADALERLGLGERERQAIRPGLVDVCLNAYGWTGPWRARRGFDSLVQMSNGIAHAGMSHYGKDRPTPLPAQCLDQACGYLMAAAALRGLSMRLAQRQGSATRLSLARMGELLVTRQAGDAGPLAPETDADLAPATEYTAWGPAHRLRPPCQIEGAPMRWDTPASALRGSEATWPTEA
ncbi:CoA transferase [Paracandidimonas lactea]|uniref:CoA transferase n=1 Tax=Paracandidimonas lactea TaxID=2895524 RepID=UPI001F476A95|nr:CoA transferase [Paracandidimonas lactea]